MSDALYDQFDSLGLVPGVVRGTRSFRIDETGQLTGVVYTQVWSAGVNDAECRVSPHLIIFYFGGGTRGETPVAPPEGHGMDKCRHGLYGYHEGSNDYHQPGYVSAVVEGWGEVMLGTRGFRCSKARILALCVSEVRLTHKDRTLLVRDRYAGIPFFDTFEEMVTAFPPDPGEKES